MSNTFDTIRPLIEKTMAFRSALALFEWDNETAAPKESGTNTSKILGILSGEYSRIMTGRELEEALRACVMDDSLTAVETGIIRVVQEEYDNMKNIPGAEWEEFAQLTAKSSRIWSEAKKSKDFKVFAPTLEKVIEYTKKFASYRLKDGEKLYDAMLERYEKEFDMKTLDLFFDNLKEEIVPLLHRILNSGKTINSGFLCGGYPEETQRRLAGFITEYIGFDFDKGILSVSAHPFTTSFHNCDVRITTKYKDCLDSSLFSAIHEAGHAIYEMGISDQLALNPASDGASMAMHESQSRFFENMIGKSLCFWKPIYGKLQEFFPQQLKNISLDQFIAAINKVKPGLIRTEADELTYCLHIIIRYEIEKLLIEDNLDVDLLPQVWADKYEEYLGIRPENEAEGVLQDIHWSQGSFGYFPSYALGTAFSAQLYFHMRRELDFDRLLEEGKLDKIREYLHEHVHQFGRMKTSRQILKDTTGEEFSPKYYIRYLKEKFEKLYNLPEESV